MADDGPPNPPDHATIPPTDCPTAMPHLDGIGGSAAFVSAAKNQVRRFLCIVPCNNNISTASHLSICSQPPTRPLLSHL